MGVKDLWSVLAPVGHHMPLKHLSGQTLAVDLSIWVVETQGVKKMKGVVTKPHLRNLFFRISHLSQLGVKLVFAIEGTAPDLKLKTMSKRQNSQFSTRPGRAPNMGSRARKPARSHFNSVLKECCEMLDCLGIPYVQSSGEAEAMCAALNSHGLVDGCLTNDGDAFLYGARVVYRNFTMNTKDPHVEVFHMNDVEHELGLSREKLVAMAILLGCDYMPQGVPGVGREMARKLMQALQGVDVLKRMKGWRQDSSLDDLETHLGRKKVSAHCVYCNHPGSQRHHDKWGCTHCSTDKSCTKNANVSCPCEWHVKQHQVELRAAECSIRQKAMKLPNFPPKNVIREFLETKDKVSSIRLTWKTPKVFHFQRLSSLKLEWEEEYSLSKVLPLLTLHEMTALAEHGHTPSIQPHTLIKSRVKHGVSCYEVAWKKLAGDTTTQTEFYVTVESQDLFTRCFPQIVQQFEQDIAAKRKATLKGKSKTKAVEATRETLGEDTDLGDVTSGLSSLQLHREVVERDQMCGLLASTAGSWMLGTDEDESDDSCVLLDTTGNVTNLLGHLPSSAQHSDVAVCDSCPSQLPVTDRSKTAETNVTEAAVLCGSADKYSDDDDDIVLSLSERLQKQKLAGLKGEKRRSPLTRCIHSTTEASVTKVELSSHKTFEPASNIQTNMNNTTAIELSVMTNQLASTMQHLYSPVRCPQFKRDDSLNPSQLLRGQNKGNKSVKVIGHPACILQEVSADRMCLDLGEQNNMCFHMQQHNRGTQQETLEEHPNKNLDHRVVESFETKASGVDRNIVSPQLSQTVHINSDDDIADGSDTEQCTKQQFSMSHQSHENQQSVCTSRTCAEMERTPIMSHCCHGHSIEKTSTVWKRNVIMSPDLFDSSCDDDDCVRASTPTPPVGVTWSQRDTDWSLCGVSNWDVETPMPSTQTGVHGIGQSCRGRVHSDVHQLGSSFEDSSFCSLLQLPGSPVLKSTHSIIKKTPLDDSAFVSSSSSTLYTDNVPERTTKHCRSLSDSTCGDIGNFKLRSSLLYESDYLSDSTDLDDSVFMRVVEPSSERELSISTHSTCSRSSSNLNILFLGQHNCHKTNDTPPRTVSDIAIKFDVQAACDISPVNDDRSLYQIDSSVCLADRLKLRLAKTNQAYLVSYLSGDTSNAAISRNDS